jgi:hypothetical protein
MHCMYWHYLFTHLCLSPDYEILSQGHFPISVSRDLYMERGQCMATEWYFLLFSL